MLSYDLDGTMPETVRYLGANAGIPKIFQGETLRPESQGETHWEEYAKFQDYVLQYPHNYWMLVLGTSGSGKTRRACATVNEILRGHSDTNAITARYFNINTDLPKILDARHFRKTDVYNTLLTNALDASILIVDDLLQVPGASWAKETVFRIYEHRYASGLPTITTVNLPVAPGGLLDPSPINQAFDEPFCRRLLQNSKDFTVVP